MKKFLVVAGVVLAALILIAGTFSAGFVAGHTLNPPAWLPVANYEQILQSGGLPQVPSGVANTGTPKDLHETQQKIVADAPMAFLSHPRRVSAINKAVKNIRMNGDGLPEDKLVMVKIDK